MANNQLLASDNFASGSLAAGWSTLSGNPFAESAILTGSPNVAQPANTDSNAYGQMWTANGTQVNQISEVTVQTLTSEVGTVFYLIVRVQTGNQSRYQAEITDGTAVIVRNDNGTNTSICTTVTGLTFASGDVWNFVADGAAICLYQNGKPICHAYDATYTSGYPGFLQGSSVNKIHCQVSAWRGYNCKQQNGIWQKQGVIIPAIAADLASSGFGTANNSQVLFEGNAQILSGNVFKTWFGTTEGICYAESSDGINWTRYSSNPVIASGFSMGVIKNGSTYNGYRSFGAGASAAYTSTNGLSWTLQNATALSLGTTGAWDATAIFYMFPVSIISGTWSALYTGVNSSGVSALGLATSSDGINWTKSASNPVLSASPWHAWTSYAIALINGVYYLWCQGEQPGQASSETGNPTDTIRYQSTDLVHWAKSSNPAPWHTQLSETVNGVIGQCIPNSIIQVGSQTFLYTTSSTEDNPGPAAYQISLAIAPLPITKLIALSEDGVSQIATDSFTNGAGPLSANWTTQSGLNAPQIVSGPFVEPAALTTNAGACYTGATFTPNQYSECTIHALGATSFINPCVRMSTGSSTRYEADINGATGTRQTAIGVFRFVNGVSTQIGPLIACTPAVGDIFRLSVTTKTDDNTVLLSLFQNGFLIYQAQDFSSSALTSGSPGFTCFATTALTNSQMSLWSGGNANVIPNFAGMIDGMLDVLKQPLETLTQL